MTRLDMLAVWLTPIAASYGAGVCIGRGEHGQLAAWAVATGVFAAIALRETWRGK